jgi:GrpB-like predicted nucleotidyltransferase (UPF0157 family)
MEKPPTEGRSQVIVEDYDPRWPERFEALRFRIAAVLGATAVTIEHVGSTAVPGLAAKPIIDVDVLLAPAGDLPLVIAKLAFLGYRHQGDLGIAGREAFETLAGDFPHHLYVCLPGNLEYQRHLAFRDHLRVHPLDAGLYASLKRRLATEFAHDRDAYTSGKSAFVAGILERYAA